MKEIIEKRGINIEAPFHTEVKKVKLDFENGDAYMLEVWSRVNDKEKVKDYLYNKIAKIMQADGYQMIRVEEKKEFVGRYKRAFGKQVF